MSSAILMFSYVQAAHVRPSTLYLSVHVITFVGLLESLECFHVTLFLIDIDMYLI